MNGTTLKRVVMGLGLCLQGSGCVGMDAARVPEEVSWRIPEDARVEELAATTPRPGDRASDWEHCGDFTMTAHEVLELLRNSRVLSQTEAHYHVDWAPCGVTGRLRSSSEPRWDLRFRISATLAAEILEGERSFYVLHEEDYQDRRTDRKSVV